MKEVNLHCLANSKQLLGVYSGLEEDFLDGAGMDVDTLGKPFVGVTLPTKFFPYYLSYVDMHKKTANFLSGSRFWTTYQLNKKARDLHERSALMLVGARICPEFEPHVISIIAILCLFYYSIISLYILFLVLCSILTTRGVAANIRKVSDMSRIIYVSSSFWACDGTDDEGHWRKQTATRVYRSLCVDLE